MASTSLTLGSHWEKFIKDKLSSGRYSTASEVIREALRLLEDRDSKLIALRGHLAEGERQAEKGEFSKLQSFDDFNAEIDE